MGGFSGHFLADKTMDTLPCVISVTNFTTGRNPSVSAVFSSRFLSGPLLQRGFKSLLSVFSKIILRVEF
jgi:hypothetical protein